MKKREGEYDISLVEIYTPEFLQKNVICNSFVFVIVFNLF